jgi:hypothetical protein
MQGRAFPPRNSWVCPLSHPPEGTTQHAVLCQENKSVTRAVAQPRKLFFFARKRRKVLHHGSLLRVNESQPQCKKGIATPISNKWCFGVHPAGPGITKNFTEFQARCKIVSVFQERLSILGSCQVYNQEGAGPFLLGPARVDQSHFAHLSCCYPDVSQSFQHAHILFPKPFPSWF